MKPEPFEPGPGNEALRRGRDARLCSESGQSGSSKQRNVINKFRLSRFLWRHFNLWSLRFLPRIKIRWYLSQINSHKVTQAPGRTEDQRHQTVQRVSELSPDGSVSPVESGPAALSSSEAALFNGFLNQNLRAAIEWTVPF